MYFKLDKMKIALVDTNDNIIGYDDKLKVHEDGLLHRAFSILIFNDDGDMLIQRRALDKYHSGGLWTNTCCSHLPENFDMENIIHIRLKEEMGFDCQLDFQYKFTYNTKFENGLTEFETDHFYIGIHNDDPIIDVNEVMDWKWISYNDLSNWINKSPYEFTFWFHQIYKNLAI